MPLPAASQAVLDLGLGLFALRRGPRDGQAIVALHNVTPSVIQVDRPRSASAMLPAWAPSATLAADLVVASRRVAVPPYGVRWLTTNGASG